jgi:hypothetical protein
MGKNAEGHPDFFTRRTRVFPFERVGDTIAESWAVVTPPAEETS